jgi:hypothetical protein
MGAIVAMPQYFTKLNNLQNQETTTKDDKDKPFGTTVAD